VIRRAAVYVRISSDPDGLRLGVTRQLDACVGKAAELGWHVAHVFEDNDVSAFSGRPRPGYAAMLRSIRSGAVDAVVVWDLDRLTRRPIEIEEFIELADAHRVALASITGEVDLSSDNGRLFARIKGAVARAEGERKSARQKAANAQRRAAGRMQRGGHRPFGYSADGSQVVAREAEAVRESVYAIIRGASISEVCRALNDRGFGTTAGNRWVPAVVARTLSNPRYAGWVAHGGEVVGRGDWPALIDDRAHRRVLAALARRAAEGRPRYLLAGVALCGLCRDGVAGVWDRRRAAPVYRCETGSHVTRPAAVIDRYVEGEFLAGVQRAAPPCASDPTAEAGMPASRARILRGRLGELAEAFADGGVDREQLEAGTARIRAALRAQGLFEAAGAEGPGLGGRPAAGVLEQWRSMTMRTRRAALRRALAVEVSPPGQGARGFAPGREVRIVWSSAGG
jgi:DNA invertase Pin-like site-specific DNA recombinase